MKLSTFGRALAIASMLSMLLSASAFVVPPPGQHTAIPKYWAEIHRWVTNFSPYAFNGPIAPIVLDDSGGLWFGVGQTAEHIDERGRMTSSVFATGPRTQVYDVARAPDGRVWFGLGQTGLIGTIDADGTPRTEVLVERRFLPDIRAIAFATNGVLFFVDVGRRSIGRRSPDGHVHEVPMPEAYAAPMTLCGNDVWVAGSSRLFAISQTSLAAPVTIEVAGVEVGNGRITSLGCDRQHRIVAAYFQYTKAEGIVFRGNRFGLRPIPKLELQRPFVSVSSDGRVRVTGYASGIHDMTRSPLILITLRSDGRMTKNRLRILSRDSGEVVAIAADRAGTVWFAFSYGNSTGELTRISVTSR